MDEPRNLQLLIVDDEIETSAKDAVSFYAARSIDVVRPAPGRAGLASWIDVVGWLGEDRGPEDLTFDLLLADVLFVQREDEPPYGGPLLPSNALVSPLGLVYALAVLAGRRGDAFPVGWAIRSQDASLVAADPVAIVAYGLHEALAGSPEDLGAQEAGAPGRGKLRLRAQHILANGFFSNNISSMLRPLLCSYRRRLARAIARRDVAIEAIHPGRSHLEPWLRERALSWPHLIEGWIRLKAGRRSTSIRLVSMFADVLWHHAAGWSVDDSVEAVMGELMPMLDASLGEVGRELWRRLDDTGFDLRAVCRTTPRAETTHLTALVVLAWIELWNAAEEGPASRPRQVRQEAGAVFSRLGIDAKNRVDSDAAYNAALDGVKRATGRTPTKLVTALNMGDWPRGGTDPVSEEVFSLGRRYLFERLGAREDDLPTAFRL